MQPLRASQASGATTVRRRLRIAGIVQGVGFRPFVYARASQLGLAGYVANDPAGVVIEVEGTPELVAVLVEALTREVPPLAIVEQIEVTAIPALGTRGFVIDASRVGGERRTLIPPDIATCADCRRELFDSADRRYGYPFINCTNCGPRFTIVCGIPYDRPLTTMGEFPMCAACAREYHDPADRRFHAEPISCPACGPTLRLIDRSGGLLRGDPIQCAAERLRAGDIIAIKGLGGYHLAAAAENEAAVAALRARKQREEKPFAVMVPHLAAARRLAEIDGVEERALLSPRRPIVLLRRRPGAAVAPSVAPANRTLGLLLPYTPVHHLLSVAFGAPFVLTSGNVSDEPIAHEDAEAFARLRGIADLFLTHDRPIHLRTDDSVIRVRDGRELLVRRARGYAPQPLMLPWRAPRPILACGPELKSTFCLVKDRSAYLSQHIGDLESYATLRAFQDGITHFRHLFEVTPAVVAHDLHPEYLSTKYALDLEEGELVGVQHHHAHVAACLADNGEAGPVIGVAFDGLGFGTDGTLWGGEFLVADLCRFARAAHLEPVPLPGGTAAIRQPWRMAAVYLARVFGPGPPPALDVVRRHHAQWDAVLRVTRGSVAAPLTSSIGRLFDAVAALLGVRDVVSYEGQAAIELEQLADPMESGEYAVHWSPEAPIRIRAADFVRGVVADLEGGTSAATVAARFHNSVARMVADVCGEIRRRTQLSVVALTGGVFQNLLLLDRTVAQLNACGFRVLTHARVPCNDGGISFGQAVVAAARDRAGSGEIRKDPHTETRRHRAG